jgi:hypothetical protein
VCAAVIPFRRRGCTNTFAPSDIAQLHKWAAQAAYSDLYLQTDYTAAGQSEWIGRGDCGDEFVSITKGSPDAPSVLRITPQDGRWVLRDHRHMPIGHFDSLRALLEKVSASVGIQGTESAWGSTSKWQGLKADKRRGPPSGFRRRGR